MVQAAKEHKRYQNDIVVHKRQAVKEFQQALALARQSQLALQSAGRLVDPLISGCQSASLTLSHTANNHGDGGISTWIHAAEAALSQALRHANEVITKAQDARTKVIHTLNNKPRIPCNLALIQQVWRDERIEPRKRSREETLATVNQTQKRARRLSRDKSTTPEVRARQTCRAGISLVNRDVHMIQLLRRPKHHRGTAGLPRRCQVLDVDSRELKAKVIKPLEQYVFFEQVQRGDPSKRLMKDTQSCTVIGFVQLHRVKIGKTGEVAWMLSQEQAQRVWDAVSCAGWPKWVDAYHTQLQLQAETPGSRPTQEAIQVLRDAAAVDERNFEEDEAEAEAEADQE